MVVAKIPLGSLVSFEKQNFVSYLQFQMHMNKSYRQKDPQKVKLMVVAKIPLGSLVVCSFMLSCKVRKLKLK